ncbi:hypothetical protein BCR44DRAFT_1440096, partial [Catenaria anguillulae PL171]
PVSVAASPARPPDHPGDHQSSELLRECLDRSTKLLADMQLTAAATSSTGLDLCTALALVSRIQTAHQAIVAGAGSRTAQDSAPEVAHRTEISISGRGRRVSNHQDGSLPSRAKRRFSSRGYRSNSRSASPEMAVGSDNCLALVTKRPKRHDSGSAPNEGPAIAARQRISSVPRAPPYAFPASLHLAVPDDILSTYFVANGTYAPRYLAPGGRLTVHGHVQRIQVLAHHLVPPRTLLMPSNRTATQQELEHVYQGNRTPNRAIAQACTRPYILVCLAHLHIGQTYGTRSWRVCDNPDVPVPPAAKLGLLVGIEMVGFEEPTADSELPPEQLRTYALRERIAIVDTSYSNVRGGLAAAEIQGIEAVEDDQDADDLHLAASASAPAASLDPSLAAIPTSLLNQISKSILACFTTLRYCPKATCASTRTTHRSRGHKLPNTSRSHPLCTEKQARPVGQVMAYAIGAGPTRPFTTHNAHQSKCNAQPHARHGLYPIRMSLVRWVARPVMLVWERLVKQVVKTWDGNESSAERRRREEELHGGHLVMLLGLELVGFEKPKAGM